ncbi:Hypothetical predicted protein [Mytilus galloprovincialis]|uniref:Uncharacterized protein n=1 Tax=Mytilus galloprovincialis TaxID=29158 RepID=A0A8B6CJX0_MYTGA|nr:Hypothetical predicted protein [Mytilus galloprovincialis]
MPTIAAIIDKIKEALLFDTSKEVSLIMLIGGFAKNDLLRNEVEINFHPKRIITTPDANFAVLKGAVLYGHQPGSIDPHVTRYTYGVKVTIPFHPNVHEDNRKFIDESVCIPRPSEEEREVEVNFIFGNTELNVRAVETRYRKEAVTYLSFE